MSDTDEIATAQLLRAVTLVGDLERFVTKIGGYATHEEQRLVRDTRAFLVEMGWREPENREPWVDRECTCRKLANGTNASTRCVLHRVATP